MGRRHPNPKLVKIHRNYKVEELAKRFDLHANTIRAWRDQGLSPIDDSKPILFHGSVVAAFLRARRTSRKRPCLPGQIYCLPCHEPKFPALRMADYVPLNGLRGNLEAMCPDCGRLIYRAVSRAGIEAIKGDLDVTIKDASPRIRGLKKSPRELSLPDQGLKPCKRTTQETSGLNGSTSRI